MGERGIVPGVQRIAVLRANALGDFVFTLPALQALRETYPEAAVTFLGKEWHAAFLSGRPGPVDDVVVLPQVRGVGCPVDSETDEPAASEFVEAMRAREFDLVFQVHGGGRYSNSLVRQLGAKVTVGLHTPDAERLDRVVPYIYFQPEILRCLEVVGAAGATTDSLQPRLCTTNEDRAEAERVCGATERFVVLHPGAGDGRRRWPVAQFAEVGRALAGAGYRVVVTGTRGEERLTAELRGLIGDEALDVCRRLSLGGLAGLLSRASLVVSNDSGPLHLAAAVGAPTVGVFWCGNLINAEPITRATNRPVLSWRLECAVCGVNTMHGRCDHDASFVDQAPVAEVIEHAFDLLRNGR